MQDPPLQADKVGIAESAQDLIHALPGSRYATGELGLTQSELGLRSSLLRAPIVLGKFQELGRRPAMDVEKGQARHLDGLWRRRALSSSIRCVPLVLVRQGCHSCAAQLTYRVQPTEMRSRISRRSPETSVTVAPQFPSMETKRLRGSVRARPSSSYRTKSALWLSNLR